MSSPSTTLAMPQPKPAPPPAAYLAASENGNGHTYSPPDGSPAPPYSTFEPKPEVSSNAAMARSITRTPSPTPSEMDVLNGTTTFNQSRSRREIIQRLAILVVIIVAIVLIEVYHTQIINGLKPVTQWLHGLRGGWVIPIVVLVALSFPPLFGHEVVIMLCGLVWGLGEGFGIAAAGTLIGEICTYFAFAYCCSGRAAKLETTNMRYGLLAHTLREGGLPVAIIARYSSLPGHLTTAVFATCGMPFWVFLVAAVVSLPKQFAIVYVGYALGKDGDSKSNKIQKIVIAITVVVTVVAMLYIRRLMKQARPAVVYQRRKARKARMQEELAATGGHGAANGNLNSAVDVEMQAVAA
ncbi:hypothetical protein HMN09_00808000 [Mycena chlorophos]|uniref:Golgi apparatus membrane protein TVP38 n=1 Tax=Mycena chlorophos TaxID=658473 RepID=A0A8H6W798_MYCCL|nr:hypothetical protein HMN09_00808000 [Mycena chlorophos]